VAFGVCFDNGVLFKGVLLDTRGCFSFSDFKVEVVVLAAVLGAVADAVLGNVVVGFAANGRDLGVVASLSVIGFLVVVGLGVGVVRDVESGLLVLVGLAGTPVLALGVVASFVGEGLLFVAGLVDVVAFVDEVILLLVVGFADAVEVDDV